MGRYCPRTDKHSRRHFGAKREGKEVKYIVPNVKGSWDELLSKARGMGGGVLVKGRWYTVKVSGAIGERTLGYR